LIGTPADKEPGDDDDDDGGGCGGLFTELRSDEIKITTPEENQPEKKRFRNYYSQSLFHRK